MNLTRVTITGADDAVPPEALVELWAQYPFVEWGILFSRTRSGTPRYPLQRWHVKMERAVAETGVRVAAHLCGEISREVIAGFSCRYLFPRYQRVQLNGFSGYRLPRLAAAFAQRDREFILQVQDKQSLEHAAELAALDSNVSSLWDCSGGRGLGPSAGERFSWPVPKDAHLRLGYAGGITPENATRAAEHVTLLPAGSTWIDMESGVRTNDAFDLDKVRAVLAAVQPFVDQGASSHG